MKGLILLIVLYLPASLWAQQNPASPTEEELLDFDNVDKGKGAASAPAPAPAPIPVQPPVQQTAPVPQVQTALPTKTAPPPPPAAVDKSDAAALEGPPHAQDNPPPPPPEIEPPPPEIVNDSPSSPVAPAPQNEEPAPRPPEVKQTENEAPTPSQSESGEISASDRRNEARFARIYQQYNQAELGDDKWTQVAGDKAEENYSLQQGDTLWDISSKFFGNGFYWPKVWQLNDQITNPHMVRVGNSLKFQPGSTTAAPSLAVEENTEKQEVNKNVELSFEDMPEPAPELEEIPTEQSPTGNTIIIPPPKKRRPVLTKIPDSFPDWRDKTGTYDSAGFSMEVFKPIEEHRAQSAVPALIVETPWDSNGKVVEMDGSSTVASTFQTVIIKTDVPTQKGDYFTVFSNNGKIYDPIEGGKVGTEVESRAEVQIEEPIEGTTDTFRGIITYTASPVRIGDLVKHGQHLERADFDNHGTPSNVAARIVNGEMNDRTVFGLHAVVFLNKGAQDGLQVGSLLNVLKNVRTRNPSSILRVDPKPIGLLKVVALDAHVSTAVIVAEKDAIIPGDETAVPTINEVKNKNSILNQPPPPGGTEAVSPEDAGTLDKPEAPPPP